MRRIISFILAAVLIIAPTAAIAQNTSNPASNDFVRIIRTGPAGGDSFQGAVLVPRVFNGVGVGYGQGTGAGGVITQTTSRATAVVLNTYSGQVTMFNAAGAATAASFTVTNSKVVATDTIILNVASGSANLYVLSVTAVAAGSFQVSYFTTGGVASDSPVINFAIVHAATS